MVCLLCREERDQVTEGTWLQGQNKVFVNKVSGLWASALLIFGNLVLGQITIMMRGFPNGEYQREMLFILIKFKLLILFHILYFCV
jgi:hypothetical protein